MEMPNTSAGTPVAAAPNPVPPQVESPIPQKKHHSLLWLILGIVVGLLILGGAYYGYQKLLAPKEEQKESTQSGKKQTTPGGLLQVTDQTEEEATSSADTNIDADTINEDVKGTAADIDNALQQIDDYQTQDDTLPTL